MALPASGAISLFDVNTELGLTRTAQLGLLCTNVRTLFGTASGAVGLQTGYGKSNTSVPGAPTGVSASATSKNSASVSFSAPSCTGNLSIDYYQAISSPGCFTATGSSPISITGLSPNTSYTFRVRAHNSKGYGCYSSSSGSITTPKPTGSITLTTVGTYSWSTPSDVSTYGLTLSIVVIGAGGSGSSSVQEYDCCCRPYYIGGGGGHGGGLNYRNNAPYTQFSGKQYNISAGASPDNGNKPYVSNSNDPPCVTWFGQNSSGSGYASPTGTGGVGVGRYGNAVYDGCLGYNNIGIGGAGGYTGYGLRPYVGGGGGAGGYSGNGGACFTSSGQGGFGASNGKYSCTTGGSGGGGGSGSAPFYGASGGGGVGLYGQGSTGYSQGPFGGGGGGGSGGSNGSNGCTSGAYSGGRGGNGGNYGGGGGGSGSTWQNNGGSGAQGAIRVVWPGCSRRFPSTCVGCP